MIARLLLGALVLCSALISAVHLSGGGIELGRCLMLLVPTILVPTGVFVAGPGVGAMADAFRTATAGGDATERRAAAATLGVFNRSLVLAGAIGFLINFISMMKTLADPALVWREFSWSLAPGAFGLVLYASLSLPLGQAIATSPEIPMPREQSRATRGLWRPGLMVVGLLIIATALVLFDLTDSGPTMLFDLPAFIATFFTAVGALLAGRRPGDLRRALGRLRDPEASAAELATARNVFSYLRRVLGVAAALGAAAGTLSLLYDAHERTRLGPNLALVMFSALYASVFVLAMALPLEAAAARRAILADEAPTARGFRQVRPDSLSDV